MNLYHIEVLVVPVPNFVSEQSRAKDEQKDRHYA